MACLQNTLKNSIVWPRDITDDPTSLAFEAIETITWKLPIAPVVRIVLKYFEMTGVIRTIRTIIWKPGFMSLCMSLYSIFTTLISRTPTKCIIKYVLKLTKEKAYFNSSMVIVVGDSVLLLQFVFVGACFYQGRGVCTHNYGYYRVFCRNERIFVLMEGKANWKIGFNSQLP